MRRLGLGQSFWFIGLFVWIVSFAIASQEGFKLSIVLALCLANLLMLATDFLRLGKVYVKSGLITLITLYPVIWRIRYPETFPPGLYSLFYIFLYIYVLIAVGSVLAVYFTRWTEEEKALSIEDVYYDEEQGWKPVPPDDLPPPWPFKSAPSERLKKSSHESK